MGEYKRVSRCLKEIRKTLSLHPRVGLVLGSGLGNFCDSMDVVSTIDYRDLEGFPVSTAPNHKGRFVFGYSEGVPLVAMQGRVHLYEGYSPEEVVLPIRILCSLGIDALILTNAAGSVNPDFVAGDLMVIRDHISSFVPSPLVGKNEERWGPRFPDMSEVYDKGLREAVHRSGEEEGIPLKEGTYLQFRGPNFETPSEVGMARILGADAVGMSTAVEAIAARHMGRKVLGVSLISNLGAGLSPTELSEEEVLETAEKVSDRFEALMKKIILNVSKI